MGEQIDFKDENFLRHMNWVMDLASDFCQKTYGESLGPAEGKVYMQVCDVLTAYLQKLEAYIEGSGHTSGSQEGDTGPKGDRSPDP